MLEKKNIIMSLACRKPGNDYVFLPLVPQVSYHSRRVFRGWLKAEMHRLTHSNNINVWLEECLESGKQVTGARSDQQGSKLFHLVQCMRLLQHKSTWHCTAAGTYRPLSAKAAGRGWWLRYLSAASLLYAEAC